MRTARLPIVSSCIPCPGEGYPPLPQTLPGKDMGLEIPTIVDRQTDRRSCGKVLFLHLFVILFTGESLSRGGGLCPEEGLCLGGLCSGWFLSRGSLSGVVSVRETPSPSAVLLRAGMHSRLSKSLA